MTRYLPRSDPGSRIVAPTPDDLRAQLGPVDEWPDDGIAVHENGPRDADPQRVSGRRRPSSTGALWEDQRRLSTVPTDPATPVG